MFRQIVKKPAAASVLLSCLLLPFGAGAAPDQERTDKIPTDKKWSERMALTVMQQSPEAWRMRDYKHLSSPKWAYTYGLTLFAMQKLYKETGDKKYLEYGKEYVDQLIDEEGNIKNYNIYDFNLDDVNAGKLLFMLYDEYGDERYLKAMQDLNTQLKWQPRTRTGGMWHKRHYPYQMWLDGLYMGAAYWAQYADTFDSPKKVWDDIAHQFILVESKTRDPETGLLYHAWDETGLQEWADDETGQSDNFWSRAMGWYSMALVDTIERMPEDHDKRDELIDIFNRLSAALVKVQHESGLWYQVPNLPDRFGNYLEASGSGMLSYAMAKGVRLGYLPNKYLQAARKAHDGLTERLMEINPVNNELHLTQICGSAGLGAYPGSPYRPGSFEYYIDEAVRVNDPHGVGPFILASLELGR